MIEYTANNGLTVAYGDFSLLIKECYLTWIKENDRLSHYNTAEEIWEKNMSKAPSIWILKELIKEICIENDLKLIKVEKNILSVKEVCDVLEDYLDLYKIVYLGVDCRLANDSQLTPFLDELSFKGDDMLYAREFNKIR